ncbi:transcription factor HES-7-like [Discoglossus pictus]
MPDMESLDMVPSRKILKPLVEKQRRDRINRSLDEMRILLLKLTGNQKLRNPKMEKAEILELAVVYIRNVTHTKTHDPNQWVTPEEKFYLSGFRDCLHRAEDFMTDVSPTTRTRFLDRLHNHLQHNLRFPKQLNHYKHGNQLEEDLSNGNQLPSTMDSPSSMDDCSSCSPSSNQSSLLFSSDSGSPSVWLPSTPANRGEFQREHDQTQTYVWRPWP